jgi:3-methyladenine DNA glycosylase/8-oxoguanine DNA glycosylase
MPTLSIDTPIGFRLESAVAFYAQFTPGSGMAAASTQGLTLAFRLDRTYEAVAAKLVERDGKLVVDVEGTSDAEAVKRQLGRILGLEGDAGGWAALGRTSPVVGALQAEFPGFFTGAKASPYDAATWAVLAPRLRIETAAALKMAMARAHGDVVTVGGAAHHVFPSPKVLAELSAFPGLSAEKMTRLRGVARAAEAGLLDAETLRSMPEDEALAALQELRGVGPWVASHIYYRGAAPIDALPTAEPRILHGLAHVLGAASITAAEYARHAEAWRPFRMWVTVLLARHLSRAGGWQAPSLAAERAASGRALKKRARHAGPRAA